MVDNTTLQNENSYLKEQLQQANESIKRFESVEKANLELVQKVAVLEASVNAKKKKKKKKNISWKISHLFFPFASW
jgi:hypothetical protein